MDRKPDKSVYRLISNVFIVSVVLQHNKKEVTAPESDSPLYLDELFLWNPMGSYWFIADRRLCIYSPNKTKLVSEYTWASKRTGVLAQDLVKSQSRQIGCYNARIGEKFDCCRDPKASVTYHETLIWVFGVLFLIS